MRPAPELTVVVPCRDEEAAIPRLEAELKPALTSLEVPFEIVAVDDRSTDATDAALRDWASRCPELVVLTGMTASRPGLGSALRAGFSTARGTWIATLDADLTFHPRQLRGLWDRRLDADLVSGSPFTAPRGSPRVSWSRRLPSLALNAFYRGLFGRTLTAYTPILRLYRASVLKSLPLKSEGFEINAEIAARMAKAGRRLAEVPAVLTERRVGRSKLRPWRELGRHLALIARLLAS